MFQGTNFLFIARIMCCPKFSHLGLRTRFLVRPLPNYLAIALSSSVVGLPLCRNQVCTEYPSSFSSHILSRRITWIALWDTLGKLQCPARPSIISPGFLSREYSSKRFHKPGLINILYRIVAKFILNRDEALGKVLKYVGPMFIDRMAKMRELGDEWTNRPVSKDTPSN